MNRNDRAISPVIGVILMVALVLLLASIITASAGSFVLDTLDTTEEEQNSLLDEISSVGDSSSSTNHYSDPNSESPVCSDVEYSTDEDGIKEITNDHELQCVNENLDEDYKIVNNIDASGTNEWNDGDGFDPIGDGQLVATGDEFTGTFDGQGYKIDGLVIDRDEEEHVGLMSGIEGATVQNVDIVNVNIEGENTVGGLSGEIQRSDISNVNVDGSISGTEGVGGLVGNVGGGEITDSSTNVNVEGDIAIGGLSAGTTNTDISHSYATGNVEGDTNVAGLVAQHGDGAEIYKSYSTGNVEGDGNNVGGLVDMNLGTINQSYSESNVKGDSNVGGLVGMNQIDGEVINSYAVGSVSGDGDVGGLVGGGFGGTVTDSYWDEEKTGQSTSFGGTDLETNEMTGESAEDNMDGFDFVDTWETVENDYPTIQ